ncbi:MAG: histidinol-phosphate transaminase [Sporolactobacillus sp.]
MFRKNLADMKAYQPGPTPEMIAESLGLARVVKLDANENVYGASPKVREAVIADALRPAQYPDSNDSDLRRALAATWRINSEELLFGMGLDEIIVLVSRAFLEPGTNAVMAWPTFYEYYSHAHIEGADVKKIPLDNAGRHDLSAMLRSIDTHTRVCWICNPNNPTGTYVNARELRDFVSAVPSDCVIAIDEAYIEFVTAADFPDALQLMRDFPNVLLLRTFSKAYGLASFRLGYAIGRARLIAEVNKVRPPFNNPRLSQVAALAALSDSAFLETCTRENRRVRERVSALLSEKGIPFYPSQTNFIFVTTSRAQAMAEQLKANGFLVNPFADGIRVTLGKMDDMKELLAVLERCFSSPV